MNMTQKEMAISCLETLDIYKPYIRKFKSKAGIPTFFENFAGFYCDQETELWEKIKKVESTTGCLVYGVTHEFTNIGETWSMLCISRDPDQVEDYITETGRKGLYYVFSYVWNVSAPECSEFGDIVVQSFGGGIRRVF